MSDGIKLDPQMDLSQGDVDLEELAYQIRLECQRSLEAVRASLIHAIRAGEYLLQAKQRVVHGEWMEWLEHHCQLSQRMANNYMRLARHQQEVLKGNCDSIREALSLLRLSSGEDLGPDADSVEEQEDSKWKRVSILDVPSSVGLAQSLPGGVEVVAVGDPGPEDSNWKRVSILEESDGEKQAEVDQRPANWNFDSILEEPTEQDPQLVEVEAVEEESNWENASILEAEVIEEDPPAPAPSKERKTRIPNDFYETAEGLTQALLHRCPELNSARILEPCAGDGAIARLFPECITNDIDPQRPCDYALDAADPTAWVEFEEVDWVVTNPPFSQAAQILPLAMDHAQFGVAFLLRLTYLEPCSDRADWLLKHADQMRFCLPCNPRPQFRQDTDSTDSTTVAWFIWLKDWSWTRLGIYPPFDFITNWR